MHDIWVGNYQSEGTQNREPPHFGEAELHQTEADDDAVKDVPALLEVQVRILHNDLHPHLSCENAREDLNDHERWWE